MKIKIPLYSYVVFGALLLVTSASAVFAQDTAPLTPTEHFDQGNVFFHFRVWDKAIDEYTAAIAGDEKNSAAYVMRGATYSKLQQFDKAIADENKALAIDPKDFVAYLRLYDAYKSLNKSDLAMISLIEYRKRLQEQIAPTTAMGFYDLAKYWENRDFWKDAANYYGEAIKLDPKIAKGSPPVTAYEKRAGYYAMVGKYDEALQDYDSAISQVGLLSPQLYFGRAYVCERFDSMKHDPVMIERAIADYTTLISNRGKKNVTDQNVADALGYRGGLYERQKLYNKAIADFTEAIKLDPKNAERYTRRAALYSQQGDYKNVVLDDTAAIAINPNDEFLYLARANMYIELKQIDNAYADFSKVIALNPKNDSAYTSRGILSKDKGEMDKALADFNAAWAINPDSFDALTNRGEVYGAKQEWDKSIADLTQAIALDDSVADVYLKRGAAYASKANWDNAAADFIKAIEIDPTKEMYYLSRSFAYRHLGKKSEVDVDYKKANELKAASVK